MSVLFLGFLIGIRHALEVDHITAVAMLVSSTKNMKGAIWQGLAWGFGHSVTLFLFGTAVLLQDAVVPKRFVQGLELVVGLMIIILGLDVIRRLFKEKRQLSAFTFIKDSEIRPTHSHTPKSKHKENKQQKNSIANIPLRALIVGSVHGMAGSAVLIILTFSLNSSLGQALVQIAMFGIGSVIGMALLSLIIAFPLRLGRQSVTPLYQTIHLSLALISCIIGAMLVVNAL